MSGYVLVKKLHNSQSSTVKSGYASVGISTFKFCLHFGGLYLHFFIYLWESLIDCLFIAVP